MDRKWSPAAASTESLSCRSRRFVAFIQRAAPSSTFFSMDRYSTTELSIRSTGVYVIAGGWSDLEEQHPTMSIASDARFRDRTSRKYAAAAITDQAGYERTLE